MMDRDQYLADEYARQERKRKRDMVMERFARHGNRVCRTILEAVLPARGPFHLQQRLGIPPARSLEQQLEAIAGYLGEFGEERFLKRANPRRSHSASPATANRITPEPKAAAPERKAPAPRGEMTAPDPRATGTHRKTHRKGDTQSRPKAAPLFDAQGHYIGPERRSATDRRSGRDRREDVKTISRNKRYGGDRRCAIRRACDRARALRGDWPPGYSQRVRTRMILKA